MVRLHSIREVYQAPATGIEITIGVLRDRIGHHVARLFGNVQGLDLGGVQLSSPEDGAISEINKSICCAGVASNLDPLIAVRWSPGHVRLNEGLSEEPEVGCQRQFAAICTDEGKNNEATGKVLKGDREIPLGPVERIGVNGRNGHRDSYQ